MNAHVKPEPGVQTTAPAPRTVYQAIAAVMGEIAREGIAKNRTNQQQGYKFRGIDDVYNALSPVMARNGLLMLPCVINRDVVERQTQKGGTLFYVTVEVEFTLVSADDGSTHMIRTFGEAMDSADKATNKAMSAAYKYAAMQAFCIPTEGDNDADAHTPELAPATHRDSAAPPKVSLAVVAAKTAIDMCRDCAELRVWEAANKAAFDEFNDAEYRDVQAYWKARYVALSPPKANGAKAVQTQQDFGLDGDQIPEFN